MVSICPITPSCAARMASVVSGCQSKLACSSSRACMFSMRLKGCSIGTARQDHHHHAAAQNADNHLANARLSDIPQLAGLSNINHRKGDDGSRVARQLKCIRDVIREVRTGPVQKPSHADMLNRKNHGSLSVCPARSSAAMAPSKLPAMRPRLLLITPPTVGKLTTAAEVIAQ